MHRHDCDHGCGNYYVCYRKTCGSVWTCQECELDDLDAYWNANPFQDSLVLEPTTAAAFRAKDEDDKS